MILSTPWLDWQLLTKRPVNIGEIAPEAWLDGFPRNVWLGTTVESADYYERIEALRRIPASVRFLSLEPLLGPLEDLPLEGIHWAIVGGESGRKRRPMDLEWVESIALQCDAAGVALFVKQDEGRFPGRQGRLPDHLWSRKELPA